MDGTLAVLFLIIGLIDMGANYCEKGCVAAKNIPARFSVSYGALIFQGETIGREAYFRYDFPFEFGPFRPSIGLSVDSLGDLWFGIGAVNIFHSEDKQSYSELSFMPGLWFGSKSGPRLGYPIEFRSGIEAGLIVTDKISVGASLDHRSNGELSTPVPNPGLETLLLRFSTTRHK